MALSAAKTLLLDAQAALVRMFGEGVANSFVEKGWFENEQRHGTRYSVTSSPLFNTATVNYSHIRYDNNKENPRPFSGIEALSVIYHPAHPHSPSMHLHISAYDWEDGSIRFRLMHDLNPAIPHKEDTKTYRQLMCDALRPLCGKAAYQAALEKGDAYFTIPTLSRTRGVWHFYMEEARDALTLASALINAVKTHYPACVTKRLDTPASNEDKKQQLAYHTLYLYQVLLLDLGTATGLKANHKNDVGTLGSLPTHVHVALLTDWLNTHHQNDPATTLLGEITAVLSDGNGEIAAVTDDKKRRLAQAVRAQALAKEAAAI